MGAVRWRGMTDRPQSLHLAVNHHVCVLGELAAPCMTVSILPGTPGHSPTQQRSDCSDSPSVPITASAETRPVRSVLASSLIPLSSAVSEGAAHSPDVSAGCCQLRERSWGKAVCGSSWPIVSLMEELCPPWDMRAGGYEGYKGCAGKLAWPRRDISFSVSVLSQFRSLFQFMCQKYLP